MRTIQALLWAGLFASQSLAAGIDQTCATCGRRALDSANILIGSVRVNQVGYRTDDPHKRAIVGDPKAATFRVLRVPGNTVAYSGDLASQGAFPYKGRIMIKGYYNSINQLYQFQNTNDSDTATKYTEQIWTADFGDLATDGTYRVAVGTDTSLPFDIRMTIYNDVFETSLKYFGIERSGDDPSQMHAPSHLKDGSGRPGGDAVAGSLKGGWYDCGDFFKVGQTDAYAFTNLILAYTLWPQKAEDRYGNSYNDTIPFGNDGIPDLLREAKVGADYVMRLYRASVADGLIAQNDMYQEVGVWNNDHQLWDLPERQDAAPVAKGGAPRPVDKGAGAAVAAQFAGSLAFFAKAWYPFDPVFADSCLLAAKAMYSNVVIPNWKTPGYAPTMFYVTEGRWDDDLAWAATGLWYATGDTSYKFDLMENTTYGNNPGYIYNVETFKAGFLAMHASKLFSPGGWMMDYQNTFIHPVWALWDLFYKTDAIAAKWKISATEAQDIRKRLLKLVGSRYASESTNGDAVYPGTVVNILKPYDLVWSSESWGMNRYNMGAVLPIVAYHEMIKQDSAASAQNYWNVVLDNMNYNLGGNPWDISFLMGAGAKNLQHPHNRISNPEGYNAGGLPYAYRSPKGALMGGAIPGQILRDEWEKYDVTETCIDFSSQMVLPAQYLALDLPPDTTGPVFFPVVSYPADTFATVSWQTNELSRDTIFYSLSVNGPVIGTFVSPLSKSKSVVIPGLKPLTTYYFWFTGMDIYRNVSRDDNRGRDYQFTTTSAAPPAPVISDVKACNIRGDQATIFWWTDIPATSSVEYAVDGANFASTKIRVDGDDEGVPGRFHKVTLKGLQSGTTYRYDVFSAPSKSDSLGFHYQFATGQKLADYTVQIAATNRNDSGKGAQFYLWVANNSNEPYVGLDLRFYFSADAVTANSIQVHVTDKINFEVTGQASQTNTTPNITVGSAVAVAGMAGVWYLPIHLADTLKVAASERFDLKMDNSNWNSIPWSTFSNAWSVISHTSPVVFSGVDMAHPWPGPDPVQNSQQVFVDDPYIAGYYNGVHIFGYTPDGDLPKLPRNVDFSFEKPLPSPATAVRQDSLMVHFQGRAWGWPDNPIVQVQRDSAPFVPATPILSKTDSVRFMDTFADPQGTTIHEWAFWADRNTPLCACRWQRYSVTVDTMKVPPRALHLVWNPTGPVDGWTSSRTTLSLVLLDALNDTLDTTATATLSSSNTGFQFWTAATGGTPISTLSITNGYAQVWVSNAAADSGRVSASASLPGSSVTSGSVWVRFSNKPPRRLSLAWTPAGPLDAWNGGQRRSATLTLLDSAGTILDTSAVANLSSSALGVQFWAGASGGTPAVSVALLHGTALVWFSDAQADTATLTAGASILGSAVANGNLVVRFAATPPWPLVDSAWTTDGSCDGTPDSVAVRLSLPLDSGAVLVSATLSLSGRNLSIPAASVAVSGRDILLPVPADLDGSATGSGVLSLHVTTGGKDRVVSDSFFVLDRVRPWMAMASVMERFAAGNDTVRVDFSEPVVLPVAWPYSTSGATAPTAVVSTRKLSPTLVEWVLSGSAFPAGSTLVVAAPGAVVDLAGNALATCAAAVALQVRTKPDPMVSAAVFDPSGTGQASAVVIRFARAVRDLDLPDSLSVLWDGTPRTVPFSNIARLPSDSSVLVGTLSVPSPAGSGLGLGGTGWIRFLKGAGATGRLDSIVARDSVGPALRSASLRAGTSQDTLVLRMSESVHEGSAPSRDLLVISGLSLPAATARLPGTDPTQWLLAIPSGLLVAGDSLRLAGAAYGAWTDIGGNWAAPAAPWVPLRAGDRAPVSAWATDQDGDGRVDLVQLVWSKTLSSRHPFRFVWPDSTGAPKLHPIDSTAGTWNGDTLRISVLWPFGATAGPGTGEQLDVYDDGSVDALPFSVMDLAAPVVVQARLGYAAQGTTQDTLVVRFSEPVQLGGATILRVRSSDGTIRDVVGRNPIQSADGLSALIFLDVTDPSLTVFSRNDAVQAYPGAAGVRDNLGNEALVTGHFEPVVFGHRPARFAFDFLPGKLVDASSAVAPTDGPTIQILVRSAGATTWQALDGSPVDPQVARIGPHILSNSTLGGEITLFDNIGSHVASRSLGDLQTAAAAGTLPVDPSGQWEAWIAWDGRSSQGRSAVSGVYSMRVILHRPSDNGKTWTGWMNKVYRIGWIRKN